MKMIVAAVALTLSTVSSAQAPKPADAPLKLWRLDCGEILVKNYNAFFSDTMAYKPGPKQLTSSCYLIRNGDRHLLWDTGVAAAMIEAPSDTAVFRITLKKSLVAQLAEIGVKPDQIEFVGVSHFHADHIGQAASFPKAKLVIGAGDLEALRAKPPHSGLQPNLIEPWLKPDSNAMAVTGDVDVFKDGRVMILTTPGHTPGHTVLLVRLASGPVLLSGDLYHFTEQVAHHGVPIFNTNRADTLASMDRFDKLAKNIGAKVIIQHEPVDIAKLPAFPKPAE